MDRVLTIQRELQVSMQSLLLKAGLNTEQVAQLNGDLVFSYGSAEVELNEIQSATFVKDGMQYQLLQINGKLSGDELVKMAEELVKMAEELVA